MVDDQSELNSANTQSEFNNVNTNKARAEKRYVVFFAVILSMCALFVLTINVLVDPFHTFEHFHVKSLDRSHYQHSRITKANVLYQRKFDQIVIGSSRPLYAFSKNNGNLPATTFNSAVENTSLKELNSLIDYSLAHNAPREIILALDFDVFYSSPPYVDEYLHSRFYSGIKPVEIILEQALSVNTLKNSVDILVNTHKPDDRISYKTRFEIILNDAVRQAIIKQPDAHFPKETWEKVANIKLATERAGVELKIIIMPVHAVLMATYTKLGLWPAFENWKRDLVALVGNDISIWDFTGVSDYQTESVPLFENDTDMQWFTDPSHCSTRYGDLILTQLASDKITVGAQINTTNVEDHLSQQRQALTAYLKSGVKEIDYINNFIANHEYYKERLLAKD